MTSSPTSHPMTAYKVLTAAELDALERDGEFAGAEVDRSDGYVHLSTADQLTATVDKHFAGQTDLQIVAVDLAAYDEGEVRWEPSRGGADFPHLYAPLRLDTAVAYGSLERLDDGTVKLPVAG